MKKKKMKARMEYLQALIKELNAMIDDLESEVVSLKVLGFDAMVSPVRSLRIGFGE